MEPKSNVEPLISRDWTPEGLLRDALGRVAAMRARGGNPGILIAVTEPGILPLISYANVDENMLAAVLLRVQLVAQDAVYARESIDDIAEERP